jgi:hypothetical protein
MIFETLKVNKEDGVVFVDIAAPPTAEAQNRFKAVLKRGFKIRDAEMDLARLPGELSGA